MMTPVRLPEGTRVDYRGIVYEVGTTDRVGGRKKLIREDTGAEVWLDDDAIALGFASGEMRVAPHRSIPTYRHEYLRADFSSMPEKTKKQAFRRREYAEALLANTALGCPKTPAEIIAEVAERRDERPPGRSTAYEWAMIWDRVGRRDIRHLVFAEAKRGKRGLRGGEEDEAEVTKVILDLYMTPQRHLVRDVHDRTVAQRLAAGKTPWSQRTVRRAIKRLSAYAVTKARRGKRAADLEYKGVGKGPIAALPGEVYEIDAHRVDLFIVDERFGLILGRVWVTAAIDRCTRMIVGFHLSIEPPSSLTIAACLRNAIAPKHYVHARWPHIGRPWVCWGVPVLVVVDNALENKAEFLKEAAAEIGFHVSFAPPRTPEFKGIIERWFGTFRSGFVGRLPGTTGYSVQDRGDYDAEAMAVATLAEVDELLHQYVITVYNRQHHTGINDVPERLWLELTAKFEVAPYTDIADLDALLGHIAWRVPSKKGIELMGLHYNGPIIELIRTRAGAADLDKVKVRFDPTDLSFIWVLDPVTGRYEVVESVEPQYTKGLTLAQHRVIRRFAVQRSRDYVTVNELCLARDALQRRIEEILGNPHATGRRTAQILRGIGSKGSWGDLYRLADDAYADGPVYDVLSLEAPDETSVGEGRAPAARPALTGPEDSGENTILERSAASNPSANPASPSDAAAAPATSAVPDDGNDIAARAKRLGFTVEGLDD